MVLKAFGGGEKMGCFYAFRGGGISENGGAVGNKKKTVVCVKTLCSRFDAHYRLWRQFMELGSCFLWNPHHAFAITSEGKNPVLVLFQVYESL